MIRTDDAEEDDDDADGGHSFHDSIALFDHSRVRCMLYHSLKRLPCHLGHYLLLLPNSQDLMMMQGRYDYDHELLVACDDIVVEGVVAVA